MGKGYEPLSTEDWNKLMRSNVVARVFPRGMAVPGGGAQEEGETPVVSPTPTPSITPTNTPTPTPSITPTLTSSPTPTPSTLPSPTIDFRTNSRNSTNNTTYNFNSQDIGGTGLIVLVVGIRSVVDATNTFSATFDGNSMTQASSITRRSSGRGTHASAIFYYNHTGASTTANFSITNSLFCQYCNIGIYRLQNLTSTTPQSISTAGNATTSTSLSTTLTGMTIGSPVIIFSDNGADIGGTTWTNATEDFDTFGEFGVSTGAQDIASSSSTTYTITFSSTNRPKTMIGASWY